MLSELTNGIASDQGHMVSPAGDELASVACRWTGITDVTRHDISAGARRPGQSRPAHRVTSRPDVMASPAKMDLTGGRVVVLITWQ